MPWPSGSWFSAGAWSSPMPRRPQSRRAGLPISQLDVTGDQVALLSTEAEAVLRALFTRGLPLTDLEVAGADLEEAFLALPGRSGAVGDAAVTTAANLGAPSPML